MPDRVAPRTRRTWPQRLLITFNAMGLVAAIATAGVLAYSNERLSEIERIDLSDVTRSDELADGDPQNYLIVGVDDASGLPDGDEVRNREAGTGLHTDTIMVMRVDPQTSSADLLSIPRDLWVPIADTGSNQRINTALQTGGPARLIKTIDENFGIPIHHYLQIDFAGFRNLVEVVDGIPVDFPRPARSRNAGLAVEEAGCFTLGPSQALGFSRARKDYEVKGDDGEWYTDPRSDFSRVERQQLFVELAIRKAITRGARNPNTLRRLVDLGAATVRIDDSLQVDNLVALGLRFRSFSPDDLVTHTLEVVDDQVGGGAVLRLQEEQAEPILALFRGVGPADPNGVAPGDVILQVRNGTGLSGQAGEVTTALVEAGFETLAAGTAGAAEMDQPTTVLYASGSETQAQFVARHVTGAVRYQVSDDLQGADVVIVTGTDWEGVAPSPRPLESVAAPTTTTTTTAPGASVSTDAADGGSSTTNGSGDQPAGDPNDPDDAAFYRARTPATGADCPATG